MGEKIFISYAREDGEFVLRLVRDLRAENADVWLDQLDIRAGETWDHVVEEALQSCAGLLVVLSPDSVGSRAVMDEVSFALDENKWVVPVIHRECKLPFRLRRVQYADFTSSYERGFSELVRVLGRTPPTTGGEPGATRAPSTGTYAPASPIQRVASQPSWRHGGESWITRHSRLLAAAAASLLGIVSTLNGAEEIYAENPLDPSEPIPFAAVAGALWAIAGAIAGDRPAPWACALVTACAGLGAWVGLIGLDPDVVWAGLIFGMPLGAIVGAVIGDALLRRRKKSV